MPITDRFRAMSVVLRPGVMSVLNIMKETGDNDIPTSRGELHGELSHRTVTALVDHGVLERRKVLGQWYYSLTPEGEVTMYTRRLDTEGLLRELK